ncbi:thiamine pyrophosphate-binding protein [Faecalicoccus pleomorphus]|uniref:thiamine pyrophosphate-binding protein n=1 Tax=Faecalicoccus pleomorphus TaxID=1323 RepID=UPI0025A4C5F7|nr:thiamine pyrophosphate-binding protein [Faecalicoccus pleomorphus]MDM8293201.1 thiamine pyrophosphate-binding protein [Faecalicoccus pleomorphus]
MANFTDEKNTLMLISLMKKHGIKKVIASPGTTNVAFVATVQQDEYFEVFSAYDERSAAYMACGMAVESGEAVALSCTQATASRNYLSGLTEAYYRKIPILAITSTQHLGRIGQNFQQAIDRSIQPVDSVKLSVQVPIIHSEDDEWYCNVLLNRALLELRRNGNGPVHINLTTAYSMEFSVRELPKVRVIRRIAFLDSFPAVYPKIDTSKKIAIFVGAHKKWSNELKEAVDEFCQHYNAVVLCDAVSNYRGKYRIMYSLVASQRQYHSPVCDIDLVIHLGDVSGAFILSSVKETWRVNPDGEIRDTFKKQTYVFAMEEEVFFQRYNQLGKDYVGDDSYLRAWRIECDKFSQKIPELPFSNGWIAQHTAEALPKKSILHLGIYNSLRQWSFFDVDESIMEYSNTGGFGIDGCVSAALGASLVTDKLVFLVIGDLAFFYDLNSMANRDVKNNLRILLINNGIGTEFKNPDNRAYKLGSLANPYIAAEGHNGKKSRNLVKHYAKDLGFQYISASTKEEFLKKVPDFVSNTTKEHPVIFEVFINTEDETETLHILYNLETSVTVSAKNLAKSFLGDSNIKRLKKILRK